MRRLLLLVLGALVLALVPAHALAAESRQGDVVVVGPTETINDDLYAFGGTVTLQGTINGDVVASGGTITVSGLVTGDLITAGGTIMVPGAVRGSIRAAGGNLTVSGPVGEDVVVAGGMVAIGPNAQVGRDLLLAGGSTSVAGRVGRNVQASVGNLTLSGPVGGNVRAQVGTIRLAAGAAVGGDLIYTSDREAVIGAGAVVRGRVERQAPAASRPPQPGGWIGAVVLGRLRTLVGMVVLGLLMVLGFPALTRGVMSTLGSAPWRSLGMGVVLLIGVPIVALVLLIAGLFVGGWWLAVIALALYGIALVLGYLIAGLFIGRWVLERLGQAGAHLVWALLVGLVVLLLLGLVPIVGIGVGLLAVLFGTGALVQAVLQARQVPALPAA